MLDKLKAHDAGLYNCLKSLSGTSVNLFVNGGNAGDSAIALATFQILNALEIDFTPIWHGADVNDKPLIIGGGGNFVHLYDSIRAAFAEYLFRANRIILLPHTIRGNREFLRRMPESVELFCRDPISYVHVVKNCQLKNVSLSHDLCFYLDITQLKLDNRRDEWDASFAESIQSIPNFEQLMEQHAFFRREDGEASGTLQRNDADISNMFNFGVWPGEAERSVWCMLNAISMPKVISTDRLHVAILGHLIDKPICLHDNTYGKNSVIYHHSMKRFGTSVFLAK